MCYGGAPAGEETFQEGCLKVRREQRTCHGASLILNPVTEMREDSLKVPRVAEGVLRTWTR